MEKCGKKAKYKFNLSANEIDSIKTMLDTIKDDYTKKRLEIILDLFLNEKSYTYIAKKFNVAKGTILNLRKKFFKYGINSIICGRVNSKAIKDLYFLVGEEKVKREVFYKVRELLNRKPAGIYSWNNENIKPYLTMLGISVSDKVIKFILDENYKPKIYSLNKEINNDIL